MKKLLFLFITLSCIGYGQDIHFSQYQENPLLVNPANTGLNKDFTGNRKLQKSMEISRGSISNYGRVF